LGELAVHRRQQAEHHRSVRSSQRLEARHQPAQLRHPEGSEQVVTFRPRAALLVLPVVQVVEEPDHNLGMAAGRSLAAVVEAV